MILLEGRSVRFIILTKFASHVERMSIAQRGRNTNWPYVGVHNDFIKGQIKLGLLSLMTMMISK